MNRALFISYLLEATVKDLPEVYPQIPLPATEALLKTLYQDFNRLYFGGELSLNFPIKFASSKEWFGLHRSRSSADGKIKTLEIKINKVIRNDRKKLIDTFLHEMIHEWQKEKFRETGDRAFLDRPPQSRRLLPGHGVNFINKMKYINSFGFDLDVTSDITSEVQVVGAVDGIVMTRDEGNGIAYKITKGTLTPETVKAAIQNVEKIWGPQFFKTAYHIRSTDGPFVMTAFNMNNKGVTRKGRGEFFNKKFIDAILKSEGTKILDKQKLEGPEGIPPDTLDVMRRLGPSAVNSSFGDYLANVLTFSKDFPDFKMSMIPNRGTAKFTDINLPDVDPRIIQFVYEKWKDISDSDLGKTPMVRGFMAELAWVARGRPRNPPNVIVRAVEDDFEKWYADRVDAKRFSTVVKKALKRKARGRNKFDVDAVWKQVFQGTRFE